MTHRHPFGLILAVSLGIAALGGCQTPAPTAVAAMAPAKQQTASQNGQPVADAMAEDQEMDDYAALADGDAAGGYTVFEVASASPEASASPSASPEASASPAASASPSANASPSASASPTARPSVTPRPVYTPRPTPRASASAAPTDGSFRGQLPPEVKAKIGERFNRARSKAQARREKMNVERDAITKGSRFARWVKNSDGTESQSISFSFEKSVNGVTMSRSVSMTRTRMADDKALVSSKTTITAKNDQFTRSSTREAHLQEDGSYKSTFHSEVTFKDGTKRVVDWTRTIAADGSVSGTGTIVWSGTVNKAINMTFGGTDEAETAKVTDDAAKTETVVTATAEGTASATATDTETGATAPVTVAASTEASASSADPAASATK